MRRIDCCRVVLLTSAVWFMLVVFVLFYVLDAGGRSSSRYAETTDAGAVVAKDGAEPAQNPAALRTTATGPDDGILSKLMRGLRFDAGGPGEMGKPVQLDKTLEEEMRQKFRANQFNVMASDRISLNRTLPDVRMAQCRSKAYPADLPATSVIIVFHNEAWSTLLRSLHSVINRSPRDLLHEIILVDDASERDYLRAPLELYVKKLGVPCQIVHLTNRSGLIRARLKGAAISTGAVLTFLDAHIEVTVGWLEPLLARIKDDRSRVVAPIIDVISDDTFEYVTASDMTWGGFNWHMNFRWYTVPKRELERRKGDRSIPIRTPTIAGGLFAIEKTYFYEIGAYDEGMHVWGGENLEISFRVWQCGGTLEIATCSHVGHVFRKQTPYTFPGGTAFVIHHNAARTVEVWMDQYKAFFYKMTPGAASVELGNITDRLELRKKLNCKPFSWYLKNIYPEAPLPAEYYSLGYVRNPQTRDCLDTMGRKDGQPAGVVKCHNMGGNQAWSLTATGELRSDETCLETGNGRGAAKLQKCHRTKGNQMWSYNETSRQLRHVASNNCLAMERESAVMRACDANDADQIWVLEDYVKTPDARTASSS